MRNSGRGVTAPTLGPSGYCWRIAEATAARVLRTALALLVEGPKGCGETRLAKRSARSEVRLERNPAAFALAQTESNRVLDGATLGGCSPVQLGLRFRDDRGESPRKRRIRSVSYSAGSNASDQIRFRGRSIRYSSSSRS